MCKLLFVWLVGEVFLSNLLTGISGEDKEENFNNISNSTKNETNVVIMSRITQPSGLVPVEKPFRLGDPIKNSTSNIKLKDFVPSPRVDEYERNKIPVKPAVPEAKSFKEAYESVPNSNRWEQNNWDSRPGIIDWRGGGGGGGGGGRGSISNNMVKFPANSDNHHHRYSLEQNNNVKGNYIPSIDPTYKQPIDSYGAKVPIDAYSLNSHLDFPKKTISDTYGSPGRSGVKLPQHKTYSGYNLFEKPAYYEEEIYYPTNYGSTYDTSVQHKPQSYEIYTEEYGNQHYGAVSPQYHKPPSPWKKIIKFLATIIPIGLLISAFTPNIISIHHNNTDHDHYYKSKYRNEDSTQEISKRLSTSVEYINKLNEGGCEDKVLCELLVSASFSKNAEEYVKTLLDNFVKQENIEDKKEDLMKIFEAVKNDNCSPIECKNQN